MMNFEFFIFTIYNFDKINFYWNKKIIYSQA